MVKNKNIDKKCVACKSSKFKKFGNELLACQNCGLIFAKDIPTFKELKKLYAEEYFFGMEYSDYIADRKALEKNFHQRIKFLKQFYNNKSKVAEVGCAYGYFLNLIKDDVKWHKGYDVSSEGIEYAKNELGLNVTTDDFLTDKSIALESLDAVFMWDVMEHFGEPDKQIEKSAKLLKKGGIVSLTTGDISAYMARRRGLKWRMIHPPTHLYYFTPNSVGELLKRYGFEVKTVRHKATYRNVGSVFNQLICNKKVKNQSTTILDLGYKTAKVFYLDRLNIPLNLYDVMEVTAIKV